MPTDPEPGEVWFAELSMAEKSRPVQILAYPQPSDARALVVVAPLTSQIRGLRAKCHWANRVGCRRFQR